MKRVVRKAIRTLKRPFNEGFTLVEILLAIGILAFALCSILALYSACLVLTSTSKNINIATNGVLALTEEIRSTPFTQIINDYQDLIFMVNDIPSSRGHVYIDDTNPELLSVTVSVCWRQGNRIIGEDANLNGVLNLGEDANGNGVIDSPVELVTLIANR
jgi:prepilin-type N-terminal cleavage/methylation domain-containing protein